MRITYREALRLGLKEALINNPKVFLIGEDVGAYGGTYAVSKDFLQEFGPDRVMDAPLSEVGFTGLGIGSALGGLKPIVEIMTVNFCLLALDQIINSAATLSFMSGKQFSVPLVIRMTTGGGRQLGAQHSHSFEGWFGHIAGIKILAPATVDDARYMLQDALADNGPVLIFEHALLLNRSEDLSEPIELVNPFKAKVRIIGTDLTVITYGIMLSRCLEAADELAKHGHSIEVIDLRALRPLDNETIFQSIKKNHRVLVVDEGWKTGSLSAEISARIHEECFYDLDAPIQRLCSKEVPMPYAAHLEQAVIPQVSDIVLKIQEMLK